MPSFKCADIGMACHFEANDPTRDGLMQKIQAHAASVHKMTTIDAATKAKIGAAIR